jgi:MinD-like ATPase involved in chromosome partitioning or flagellar assembly
MNKKQLHDAIVQNLDRAGMQAEEVRVQPDSISGWRIAVVCSQFAKKSPSARRQIALDGIPQQEIEWADLLTPEEREWAGELPADIAAEQLPLWPEAMARANQERRILFPSDLDEDLELPFFATFYSLRGGVGRSTALAYTGRILASRGRKVVCVDMDLEAPGLAALFGKEDEVGGEQGVVPLLVAFDRGEQPDISKHLVRVVDDEDLYCLPAGRVSAEYARLLRLLDPSAWYREERNPLRDLLEHLRNRLPFRPDVVLLDSRTGMTALSAPLLFDLADLAVITFFPHPQTATGTAELVRALLAAHTYRSSPVRALTPEPRFLVSPIPATKLREITQRYEHRALEWIGDWLTGVDAGAPTIESDITHFVPYREALATSDQILRDPDVWRDFEPIANWIERFLPTKQEQRVAVSVGSRKTQILSELKFSAGTAEQQEDLLATFVETDLVRSATDPKTPLVLGRKGTGKTALFRLLSEGTQYNSIVAHSPGGLRRGLDWILGPDGFKAVDEILQENGAEWRQFWAFYTCAALAKSAGPLSLEDLGPIRVGAFQTELEVVRAFAEATKHPQLGLLLTNALTEFDRGTSRETLLLFDGLDTGFGSTETERERRGRALEGLFTFWTDRGDSFNKLTFKILLREDIWRKLRFENKSHLFGRSVTLKWSDQAAFFKVVVKQALRSAAFKNFLFTTPGMDRSPEQDPNLWIDAQIFYAWNLLVGERMKGGKTAFTRNWVWNRLADGNDDHSPRFLLQLFQAVTSWENKEQAKSAYEQTVIRPRALIECLPTVSEQALDSLKEEFVELEEFLHRLREIGRTPVAAEELEGAQDGVTLAREIGLLSVYEGTDESVGRYKVPEIYRIALGMTRKGQA